ncbi:MAG TPA: cytochrome P450 [Tepidisphaeraceae bacterium]|nr:cytochrome P450 [Tepidisphaeraceae bacterium]
MTDRAANPPARAPLAPGAPFIGLAARMRARPLQTLEQAFRDTGDGEAVFIRLGPYKATIFRHPDLIKRIFVDNAANYTKQTRGYLKARLVLGDGLVTSEGELWQRQRRIATPAFHRQRIAAFAEIMVSATEKMTGTWASQCEPANGTTIDIFRELMNVTLHIAVQTLIGIPAGKELDDVSAAVTEVLERTNDIITNPLSLPLWFPLPKYARFKSSLRVLDEFVYSAIESKRRKPAATESADLLSMLLAARDEQTGEGMSDRQLRDEAVTILIAGHETTANALSWAIWLLGEHPDMQQRAFEEVSAVIGKRSAGIEHLPALKFTRAVAEEAMRLYPPAWMIGRRAICDDTIGPYTIRADEFALISPYLTHRHPGLWDDPAKFDPGRFLDGRSERLPKFAYMPFGGGMRFCIGASFAMIQATLMLATMIRRVCFERVTEQHVEPYAMITLRPKHGILMQAQPRKM